jgi:hypothetical protein
MTIRYMNGSAQEAMLLSRTETELRIALRGSDDVLSLNHIGGTWVTEDCEPVHVDFAWSRLPAGEPFTESDCVCSHDLAAHLIHLLYTGDEELQAAEPAAVTRTWVDTALPGIVS